MNSQHISPSEHTLSNAHPLPAQTMDTAILTHIQSKNYVVKIYTPQLDLTSYTIHDRLVDGRDVAELTGIRSADEYVVLQVLSPNQATEERRLEEKFELDASNDNVFFVGKADGTLNALIDGMRVAWFNLPITAQVIRLLAGKGDDFAVFQVLPGQPDKLITAGEAVSLRGNGVEHFRTEKIKQMVTVYLADVPHEIRRGNYTTEDLKQALCVAENYVLDLVGEDGSFIELRPGQRLDVIEGMKFVAYLPTGHSS